MRNVEQTTTVNETMVASSVIAVHSSPDESHDDSQSDEGFVEPKHPFFKKKPTYEVGKATFQTPWLITTKK